MTDDIFERGVELTCALFIEREDGRLIFVRSPKWGDRLVVPGGHVEPGERVVDAALREAAEEVGLQGQDPVVLGWSEVINPPGFHRSAHFVMFAVHMRAAGPVCLDGVEIVESLWLRPAEALVAGDLAEYCRPFLMEIVQSEAIDDVRIKALRGIRD